MQMIINSEWESYFPPYQFNAINEINVFDEE